MLKLYNSLSNQIEIFKPYEKQHVNMYVCGPTVYGHIHIGNARPVIFFDMLKSYLVFSGYKVIYASNITDVDDRIIDKAKAEATTESVIAKRYTHAFFEATKALGSKFPDVIPYATDYMDQTMTYITDLIEKDYAYIKPSGVYFRVHKIKDYGILSNQSVEKLRQGVRVDMQSDKENFEDFALWKTTQEGLSYPSLWGQGRPGWHTECAVMTHDIFKKPLDIHGGGFDLKFPHHENEIAQSVAHDGHHLAKYWMHVGRVDYQHEKMSKSLGNVILVKDLLKRIDGKIYRLYILSHHYRQPIEFNEEVLMNSQLFYEKVVQVLKRTKFLLRINHISSVELDSEFIKHFKDAMDDDLNTPNVITIIEDLLKRMNKTKDMTILVKLYNSLNTVLECWNIYPNMDEVSEADIQNYHMWQEARLAKDYEKADVYRDYLLLKGWI